MTMTKPPADAATVTPEALRSRLSVTQKATLSRLGACLAGSVVLAVMIGDQEGSATDYGYAVRQAFAGGRLFVFLGLGLLVFAGLTFSTRVVPYLSRPGITPLASGAAAVAAGLFLMTWYDGTGVGDGKFGGVADAVASTPQASALTSAFFAWLAYASLAGILVIAGLAIVTGIRPIAWLGTVLGVLLAVVAWQAHSDVVGIAGGIDHSLGYGAAAIGYLVLGGACVMVATSTADVAATREFVNRVLGWRPGLVLVLVGGVLGVVAFVVARWFAPGNSRYNTTFGDTFAVFDPAGLTSAALTYLHYLGWVLFAVSAVLSLAATYLCNRLLGLIGGVVGVAASIYTVYVMYKFSDLAATLSPTDGGTWQNLGTGGWIAGAAFLLMGGGAVVAVTAGRRPASAADAANREAGPTVTTVKSSTGTGFLSAPGASRSAVFLVVAFALFYPPTATSFWQKVLVTEIGIYVLLAIGLNVVVGWAGLLDLGFIAFYAIGSYTTAYFTGVLPIKPPDWLILSPLLAIPFAVFICLLAGVALGAPTLRLRGDYLAIVTLGFGEIIRIVANNADGITNGSRGTAVDPSRGVNNVPSPEVHVGPVNIVWGLNQLQYWYLLLVFLIIVLLAFRRLENSRIGRAWAAIREDEVAAQATGVNTYRLKLLAFAIGASTSGIAGVFFASQVGFFNPDNFVLNNSILVVAYVVFGGMGSLTGAMAGAALLTWLPEFLKDQVPGADRQMWIGAVVLLMMIFRPAGLLPARRRRAELDGLQDDSSASVRAVPAAGAM